MNDDLVRVRRRVLAVLSEDDTPLPGLVTGAIRDRVRGQDKGLLLEALWELQEDGIVEVEEVSYQGQPGLRWRLEDPASLPGM